MHAERVAHDGPSVVICFGVVSRARAGRALRCGRAVCSTLCMLALENARACMWCVHRSVWLDRVITCGSPVRVCLMRQCVDRVWQDGSNYHWQPDLLSLPVLLNQHVSHAIQSAHPSGKSSFPREAISGGRVEFAAGEEAQNVASIGRSCIRQYS